MEEEDHPSGGNDEPENIQPGAKRKGTDDGGAGQSFPIPVRDPAKKPLKKRCETDACKVKPVPKPNGKTDKKKVRAGDRLKKTGKKMGTVTKDVLKSSADAALHPGRSTYLIVTSSGEVVGTITEGMLKSGQVVVKRTKNGMVLVKGSAERISGAEEAETKDQYYKRLIFFFGPLAALVLVYLMYFVFFDIDEAVKLLISAVAYLIMFPGVDKTTLITSTSISGINQYQMAFNIWVQDSILGTFLCLNFDYVKRIPLLGGLVSTFERTGRKILKKHRWLLTFSTVGLFLFIVLPFQGSGALAGSIVGRLVGMKPVRVIPAVILGTLASVMILATISSLIHRFFPVWLGYAVPITIYVLIIATLAFTFINKRRKAKDPHYQLYLKEQEEAEEEAFLAEPEAE